MVLDLRCLRNWRRCCGLILVAVVCLQVDQTLHAQTAKAAIRGMHSAIASLDEKVEAAERAVMAIEALEGFDNKSTALALLDAAEKLVRLAVPIIERRHKGLASEGGSGRLKRARYELRHVDDALEAVARTLYQLRSAAARKVMLLRTLDHASGLPMWLRMGLAARVTELPVVKIDWQRAAKSKSVDALLAWIAIADGLGNSAGVKCGEWLGRELEHPNRDVRIQSATALGKLAWPAAMPLMIDRLDHESSDVHQALLDALTVLTSQDPGRSSGSWRAWLESEGAAFLDGDMPLSKGQVNDQQKTSDSDTKVSTYFGIKQIGDSILYVFDNSQSMQAKLGNPKKGGSPITGAAAKSRWDLCRLELKVGLRGLRPDQKFNLVSFANKARSFEPVMQFATKANVERAVEWIDRLKLEFQTNVFDALDLAFMIAGCGSDGGYYASQVDTIFFLSDGAPTIANLYAKGIVQDDADRILSAVSRWNLLGRIKIHAVGLGLPSRKKERKQDGRLWPIHFLKKLAGQNHGSYISRR